jgi:hypothetical protein
MHRTAENETPRRYVPQDRSSAVVRATHYTPAQNQDAKRYIVISIDFSKNKRNQQAPRKEHVHMERT